VNKAVLLAMLMAAPLSVIADPVDFLDYDSLSEAEHLTLGLVLVGAGDAYSWANATLSKRGDAPLFCTPPSLALNGKNFQSIYREELSRNGALYRATIERQVAASKDLVAFVLLQGLRRTFPCSAS